MEEITEKMSECSLKKDNDISHNKNINKIYNDDKTKDWIKLISINSTISFDKYTRKDKFIQVANIVLDDENKSNGSKKRNTLIRFIPTISKKDFDEDIEWIYIFTINQRIVKIGGTRTGLKGRVGSYLCGHHIAERGKSGDCSKTNAYIYNTFVFYAKLGCMIDMYAYKLPKSEKEIELFGKKEQAIVQTYHAYESIFIADYKKTYRFIPILCDNSDPNYREK